MEVESHHFLSCNRFCFSTQARSHKPAKTSKAAAASSSQRGSSKNKKAVVPDFPKLKSEYGVDAWKRWIKWRKTQPDLEKPRYGCKSLLCFAICWTVLSKTPNSIAILCTEITSWKIKSVVSQTEKTDVSFTVQKKLGDAKSGFAVLSQVL